MEGIFFLADIVLMLLLVLAIFRGERGQASEYLGLFAYKPDEENASHDVNTGAGRRDA